MTGTTPLEPVDSEAWTPQHWSREEWFYMWTKGLDPWRIAVLCRVPYRKVYDHIHTRVNHNPALFGQRLMLHDHPQLPRGGLKNRKPTWQERASELAEFRRAQGRFPRGYLEDETKLYSFLQYQRDKHRQGKLSGDQKSYLDENLRGWLTLPKQEREAVLWERRASELDFFLIQHGRFPSYKSAKAPMEKVLATWLTSQRSLLRSGKLDSRKIGRLAEISSVWMGRMHKAVTGDGPPAET